MKACTIDAENNISFYDSKAEATAALTGEGAVFTSKDQLAQATANATIPTLVEIFNSFSGVTLVKKFASKAIAVTRIWNECQKMAGETTEETANVGEQAAPVAPAAKPAGEGRSPGWRELRTEPGSARARAPHDWWRSAAAPTTILDPPPAE